MENLREIDLVGPFWTKKNVLWVEFRCGSRGSDQMAMLGAQKLKIDKMDLDGSPDRARAMPILRISLRIQRKRRFRFFRNTIP